MLYKLYILVAGCCLAGFIAVAQDTTRTQTVNISSVFRPVLKHAVKLNFTASPPAPDDTRPNLAYNIPVQNLFFNLQPVALKPLALQIDSAGQAHNSNYVKIGYGNFSTPLVDAGFTLGDGKKTNFNLFASHIAQKGDLRAQRFSNTAFAAHLNTVLNKVEVYGKAGYQQQSFYLYGPDPSTVSAKEDSLRKPYQTINLRAGLRNAFVNSFGLIYNPDLNINIFGDTKANETNAVLNVPVDVNIGTNFGLSFTGNVDLTSFKPTGGNNYTNNVYFLNAAALLKTSKVYLRAGVRPTWDNSNLKVLPDILLDFHLQEKKIILTGGWTAHVRKNTYQYLVSQNPWINQPLTQFNTRITEAYGGFKGTLANSFNYRVQAGFIEYLNLPLFVNLSKPAVFDVLQEAKLQGVRINAELGLVVQDKFNASAKLDIYNFFNQQTYARAYHILPLQLTTAARWQPVKKVMVKVDAFAWPGAVYLKDNAGNTGRLSSAFDLNAGAEFRFHKSLGAWVQFNNLANSAYQRWNNYDVLGFNVVGGIRLTFDQKQK
jgi:hypothetical protein